MSTPIYGGNNNTPVVPQHPYTVGPDGVVTNTFSNQFLAKKVFGGNITVKPSGLGWAGLFAEWDWLNWVKPQVDRAVALGMNTVRIICAPEVVLVNPSNALPLISQATYLSRLSQLAEYCLSKNVYLYPALCQKWDYIDYETAQGGSAPWDFQNATVTAVITASAQTLAAYPNVIGFDVFQEGDLVSGLVLADILALYTAIRGVCKVPLTTSLSSGGFGTAAGFWQDTTSLQYTCYTAVGGSDFIDLHVYLDGVLPSDIDQYQYNVNYKPIIIGEYGDSQDQSQGNITARYTAMALLHNRNNLIGSLCWALADQTVTAANEWGVWDNTGFTQPIFPSSAGSTPLSVTTGKRTYITNVFKTFMLSPQMGVYQPYNLLTPIQSRARNTATPAGWSVGANTYFYSENRGIGFSATAGTAGTLIRTTPDTGIPVAASTYYTMTCVVLAGGATTRTVSANLDWYDSGGVYISSATAITGTDSATVPLVLQNTVRSPANAVYVDVVVKISATIAINEAHVLMSSSLTLA